MGMVAVGLFASGLGCKPETLSGPLGVVARDEAAAADDSDAPETKLKIGDPAPSLVDPTWLKGEPVAQFADDSVYVVEFWATWCGPCISSMPHLDALAKKYREHGLVVLAVTTADAANTREAVTNFIETRGAEYDFRFAFCDSRGTYDAYMKAANPNGIPCSFVVNKAGQVAFIGHPTELDEVLPQIFEGTWNLDRARRLAAANQELQAAMEQLHEDPQRALTAMDRFAKKYPEKADEENFQLLRIAALAMTKQFDQLPAVVEPRIAALKEQKNGEGLVALAFSLLGTNYRAPDPQVVRLGTQAVEAGLAFGESDPELLLAVSQIYLLLGEREKSRIYGQKAVDTAPAEMKSEITEQFEQLQRITPEDLQRAADAVPQ